VTIRSHSPIALLAAAALLVAGCGSDKEGKPIPATQATELERQLDSIERRFDFGDGACADIEDKSIPAVRQQLDSIPSSVDSDVRDALRQSFDRLFELTASQCDEQKNQKTTPTETTTTETTPTETTPKETTPTETTPTQTEKQPPGQEKKDEKNPGSGGQKAPSPSGGDDGGGAGGAPGQG
jgi:cell division septation protein DedD